LKAALPLGTRQHPQLYQTEMTMSEQQLDLLKREHARLEKEIDQATRRLLPDEIAIARLKKLKLAVKDQIDAWQRDLSDNQVA
jgi:hypothetical protein